MDIADITAPYRIAQAATLAVGFLFFAQTLVGVVARRRTGQVPGQPVTGGPTSFVFRADRARCNLFEVLGFFCVALVLAMSLGAPATMVNAGAVIFAVARVGHMLSYYADLGRPRQLSFMVGNMGVVVLLFASARRLLG